MAGSLQVLEALIVATVMIGAVTYVATIEPRNSSEYRIQEILEQESQTFLPILNDLHSRNNCHQTYLEQLIDEGVRGVSNTWSARTESTFGPGIDSSLLLDNGFGVYPLQEKRLLIGATQEFSIQPDWSTSLVMTTTNHVDGTSYLAADTYATHYAEMISVKGELVRTSFQSHRVLEPATDERWSLTAMVGASRTTSTVNSMTWQSSITGTPVPVLRLSARDLLDSSSRIPLYLMPEVHAPGAPATTFINVSFPAGWDVVPVPGDGWISVEASSRTQFTFQLREMTATAPAVQPIQFQVKPPTTVTSTRDIILAEASGGSRSFTPLPIAYPVQPIDRDLQPLFYPTTPYPISLGSTAIFGATLVNGGIDTVVTHIEIDVPGGYDIRHNDGAGARLFTAAEALLEPVEGSTTMKDGKRIIWHGNASVPAGDVAAWFFEVQITSDESQATGYESDDGPTSTFTFTNDTGATFTHESSSWGPSPGMIRHRVPADDPATTESLDGYPAELDDGVTMREYEFDTHLSSVMAQLDGEGSYTVSLDGGDLARLDNALAGSSFRVSERMARIGSVVSVDADLESVFTELARVGAEDVTLTIDMYAPPSKGCWPTRSWVVDQGSDVVAPVRGAATARAPEGGLLGESLFFVADDDKAYRIDAADAAGIPVEGGLSRWTHPLDGDGTRALPFETSNGETVVIVGDGSGALRRLSALTGEAVWSAEMAAGAPVALAADAQGEWIAAVSSSGVVEVRSVSTGVLRGTAIDPDALPASSQWNVTFLSDDRVAAFDDAGVGVFDPVGGSGIVSTVGALALTEAPGDVIRVLGAGGVRTLDAATLELLPDGAPAPASPVILGASADVDGDGVLDLLGALQDRKLAVWSGATAEQLWIAGNADPSTMGALDPTRGKLNANGGPDLECGGVNDLDTYHAEVVCEVASGEEDSHAETHGVAMDADPEGAVFATQRKSATRVRLVETGGDVPWEAKFDAFTITTLQLGVWGSTEVVIVGLNDGHMLVLDRATGDVVEEMQPTDFVGRFSLPLPIPGGGFFGAHLLVATLSWQDETENTQSASLADWFVVVDPDGKPVAKPAYRAVLVVSDPASERSTG